MKYKMLPHALLLQMVNPDWRWNPRSQWQSCQVPVLNMVSQNS